MSIIEQAAKRLEELKRAGIQIPAVFESPVAPSAPAAFAPPAAAPVAAPAVPPATLVASPVLDLSPVAASQPVTVTKPVASSTAIVTELSGRRSREVTLDLSRLAAEGYLVPSQGRSLLAEQMRILKRPLLANASGESALKLARPNLILVSSAMPGEGKTFLAMNLAMSMAMEVDHSVLLVDADVLRPSVLSRYGVEPSRGLLDVLGSSNLDLADVMLRTNVPKLNLLSAGTANAKSTELLASAAMETLLNDLAVKYPDRIIVFDAPPLIPTTESRVLASRVGQVVMVVEAHHTTHSQVVQAYAAVEKCPVVLSVLNKTRATGAGESYGYYYAA
jgi:protein-tyrosine kinase